MGKVGYNQGKAKAATVEHIGREFYDRVLEYTDDHIDRSRTPNNLIWTPDKGWYTTETGTDSLSAKEVLVYEQHFSKGLEAQNKRYKEKGNKSKCIKNIQEYYKMHQPHEAILQFGNKEDFWDVTGYDTEGRPIWGNLNEAKFKDNAEVVRYEVDEFIRRAKEAGLEVLDAVIHLDESVPHAHIRFIGIDTDKHGFERIDMTNCLKKHGFNQTTEDGDKRYANPLKEFTAWMRKDIEDYLEEEIGVEVDRDRIAGASDLKTWLENINGARNKIASLIHQLETLKNEPFPDDVETTLKQAEDIISYRAKALKKAANNPANSTKAKGYIDQSQAYDATAAKLNDLRRIIETQQHAKQAYDRTQQLLDEAYKELAYHKAPVKPSNEDMQL